MIQIHLSYKLRPYTNVSWTLHYRIKVFVSYESSNLSGIDSPRISKNSLSYASVTASHV
jgi:hypothetical protein